MIVKAPDLPFRTDRGWCYGQEAAESTEHVEPEFSALFCKMFRFSELCVTLSDQ